jgi:cyclopropane-fatty-acyl-phospholipid synthase
MEAMERGLLPDAAVRWGIRRLCSQRLALEASRRVSGGDVAAFAEALERSPVAPVPEKANEQHYEVPPDLFRLMLGPRLKYSCCYWESPGGSLERAEEDSLRITGERAGVEDGMRILELGCGWGSLSLWLAEQLPRATIVSVSNSRSQRAFIEDRARARGLANLSIVTADMNAYDAGRRFDRIISVEMFEHMRNYRTLLARTARWLHPDGRLFVHVFCHQRYPYVFETEGAHNWMGRHFFTGGIMPSVDLLPAVAAPFALEEQWHWSGMHYARTAEAWLDNLDANRSDVLDVLGRTYGPARATRWLNRWRVFTMACAELFAYGEGREWGVAHYRFAPA